MKKFLSFFATLALALGFTACEDVPAPFAINDEGGTQTGFYYMSNNLSSGWTLKVRDNPGAKVVLTCRQQASRSGTVPTRRATRKWKAGLSLPHSTLLVLRS